MIRHQCHQCHSCLVIQTESRGDDEAERVEDARLRLPDLLGGAGVVVEAGVQITGDTTYTSANLLVINIVVIPTSWS